jgi:hypothetical protein
LLKGRAGAALLAIGVAVALSGGAVPGAGLAPANAASTASPAVPEYYVALPGANNNGNVPGSTRALVADTFTGKTVAVLKPPAGWKFTSVSPGADDRTFVLGVEYHPEPPAVPEATAWYLVHLTPGAKFRATMRKLRVPVPSGTGVVAVALSPDARELATIGDVTGAIGRTGKERLALRVYSVATGALLRTWQGVFFGGFDAYTSLQWTPSGYLTFARSWFAPWAPREFFGVRMLKATHSAGDLVADSRLVWSTPVPLETPATHKFSCAYGGLLALVSGDGTTVACSAYGVYRTPPAFNGPACPNVHAWNDPGFLEYSTATGKLVRTLFRYDTNCFTNGLGILWTSAAGDAVIGYYSLGSYSPGAPSVTRFGVFRQNTFTPLPVPVTTETTPLSIAW